MNRSPMWSTVPFFVAAAMLGLAVPGCDAADTSSADPSYGCAGKCDDATPSSAAIEPFEAVDVFDVRSDPDADTQSLSIALELNDVFYDAAREGDSLDVLLRGAESSAADDFAVRCEATYSASNADAFICSSLDTSDLLPWSVLEVQVSGELDGMPVRQVLEVEASSLPDSSDTPLEPLVDLEFFMFESDGETLLGVFNGDLRDDVWVDRYEHDLMVEVSGADSTAAEGFVLRADMSGDGGRLVADPLDLGELFPVEKVRARVVGTFEGHPVEQTFEFDIDELTEW